MRDIRQSARSLLSRSDSAPRLAAAREGEGHGQVDQEVSHLQEEEEVV